MNVEEKIAYKKEYYGRPEVKARAQKYGRERYNKPEVKARVLEYGKEYRNRPEVKARIQRYCREYQKRPGVRARINECERKRYHKKLQKKEPLYIKPGFFRDLTKYQKNIIVTIPEKRKQIDSFKTQAESKADF